MTNTYKKDDQRTSSTLRIITQAFYGNRTMTEIEPEDMDRFILGYLDSSMKISEPIDRTVVRIPGTDGLVLVYNKYQEAESLKEKEELLEERGYEMKPLAEVPELGLRLYSRCIALRITEEGEYASIQRGDGAYIMKYLAP